MYTFHVTLHALPREAAPGPAVRLKDREWPTLAVPPEVLGQTSFACSFEEASAELDRLERMYCEPDGSFVWVSSQQVGASPSSPWQVDGNLYDRQEKLLFVDLQGTCPPEEFDRLLACFGWPETPVMFQLMREAVLLDEQKFREWAAVGAAR